MCRPFVALAILLFLLHSLTIAAASEKPWTEVRSQHFRVLTNGSTQDATKVAKEFEQLRWVFATRFPGARLESGAPFTVFATRDSATAKGLDPATWRTMGERLAGVFHHGQERQFALVRLDTFWGNGAKEVVYHEYAHSILHMTFRWLPRWLDEGTAEFYGYTRFEDNKIYLGAPTERFRALHSRVPDSIEEIMGSKPLSRPYDGEFFYAESWALVHFLIYGPGMDGGKKLEQFVNLLQEGKDQRKAFQQAFGDPADLNKDLSTSTWAPDGELNTGTVGQAFSVTVLKSPPQINEKEFSIRTISLAETQAELASYHLWTRDHEGARSLTEEALKNDPKLGLAHEELAFLDFADGKDAEAASEFAQAYAFDNKLYLSQFAKTMMSGLTTSNKVQDMNALGSELGKVLQINPLFSPAYVQLAKLAYREGDFPTALMISRKAEEFDPSLAGYHLLSGQILLHMGKGSEAADAARFVADRWGGPDHNEAVELWSKVPAADRTGDALSKVVPKDTKEAEGLVKTIACSDKEQEFSLALEHGGHLLMFRHKAGFPVGFSDTIWYGGDHFDRCRHIEGLRAIVHYRAANDATYAGDIVELELRDDLPEPLHGP